MGGKHANYSVVARCTIGTGCRPVLVARNLGNGASFDGAARYVRRRGLPDIRSRVHLSNVKLVPLTDAGRVTSAPNCYASALTKRVPRRLLVTGSNPAGRPAPSSRTETKIELSSIRTRRTQIKPDELGYAYLPAFRTNSLMTKATRMARSAAN